MEIKCCKKEWRRRIWIEVEFLDKPEM